MKTLASIRNQDTTAFDMPILDAFKAAITYLGKDATIKALCGKESSKKSTIEGKK